MKNLLNKTTRINNSKNNFIMNPIKTIKKGMLAAFITVSAAFMLQSCNNDDNSPIFSNSGTQAYREMAQKNHELWGEHMQWTYTVVDYFFHRPDELGPQLNRLLQNQNDIGAQVSKYFGQDNGNQVAQLLTDHIVGAVPVLTSAQEGDNEALAAALDDWYANAQEVGDKFAQINPEHWSQENMRNVWATHITQTVDYSVNLLQGDFDNSIMNYQKAWNHMIGFAEILSDGIANKFPEQFR